MANQQWWTSGMKPQRNNFGTPDPARPLNQSGEFYGLGGSGGYQPPPRWEYQPPSLPGLPSRGSIMGGTPTPSSLPPHGYVPTDPLGTRLTPRQQWGESTGGSAPANGWQPSPGQTPGQYGPIWNMWDPDVYKRDWEQVQRFLQGWYFPQQEQMQNAFQWGSEFDEAGRRWDSEMGMQTLMNQFGMDLQTQQQQMAEWEAQEAARQWAEQFGWTQETDRWSRELSQQELAQRELLQRMQDESALQQGRLSAFGRAERPNVRFTRNWG